MGWACVQTYSGQERYAVENLDRQGYEALCPTYVLPRTGRRPDPLREVPLFPGYVFVLIVEGRVWSSIRSTYGCIRLLTEGANHSQKPLYVAESFVRSLEGLRVRRRVPTNARVRVRRADSPFYDMVGTVLSLDKSERARVLMSLFSRDIEVEIDVDDLDVESETVLTDGTGREVVLA